MSTDVPPTTTPEEDFLDADPAVRGQNYVCLSFLSPSDVVHKKEAWIWSKFTEHFSKDVDEMLTNLQNTFPDFAGNVRSIRERHAYLFGSTEMSDEFKQFYSNNFKELEDKYFSENNFQPTIYGLKVRGVYETQKEAQNRAMVLKKTDRKFDVYVGQVGLWLPWSPPCSAVESQEYMEKELQEMMQKYKENQDLKDHYFTTRKDMLLNTEPDDINPQVFVKEDTWLQNKEEEAELKPDS